MQTVRAFVMPDGDIISCEIEMQVPRNNASIIITHQEQQGAEYLLQVAVQHNGSRMTRQIFTRELRHTIPDPTTSIKFVIVGGTDGWGNRITPIRLEV